MNIIQFYIELSEIIGSYEEMSNKIDVLIHKAESSGLDININKEDLLKKLESNQKNVLPDEETIDTSYEEVMEDEEESYEESYEEEDSYSYEESYEPGEDN
jgi:hypothetical protein